MGDDQDSEGETLGLVVEEEEPVATTQRYSEQVQQILAQEEAFHLLSCESMVQNLVKDSVSRRRIVQQEEEEEASVVEAKEEECYWDMPCASTTSSSCTAADTTTATSQECPVQAALESVTSSSSSSTTSNDQVMTAAHVNDASHPNHAYWDHPSDTLSPKDRQAQLLQSILKSEAIRNLLSVEHVSQVERLNSVITVSGKQVQHEFYSQDVSDKYWNTTVEQVEEASHVQDGTHPNHAYWDESTTAAAATDEKQALIEQILKEERLRNLVSTDFIVQTELESSCATTTTPTPTISSPSSPESQDYWIQPNQISTEVMQELSKQDLIQRIVQEEKDRYLVSTDCMVQQLVKDSQELGTAAAAVSSVAATSSPCVVNADCSYWDW